MLTGLSFVSRRSVGEGALVGDKLSVPSGDNVEKSSVPEYYQGFSDLPDRIQCFF